MRVLVTGHKGYIGTILTPMLTRAGHDVHGLDSDIFERCTYGEMPPVVPETIKDIRDVERSDVEGFDAVLHLAGLSNDPLGDLNADLTYEINHKASVRLAELSKDAGVSRFIFSSSCSNYGAGGGAGLLDEDSELNPVTPYGKSKVFVERDVSSMADDTFTCCYLRNATAYGVSPRLRFDLVLNNLVAWAVTTGKVHLKSDGSAWRPLVHIGDISAAFLATLEAPAEAIQNKPFNVGVPGENFRIRQIAEMVKETVPNSELRFEEGASADTRNYQVDCSRLPASVPAFKTSWTVQKGIQECYESFTKSGVTLEEFEGIRYKRIDHVRNLIQGGILDEKLRHKAR
jgi:nucleoside-diphosphate-sugar epimerase